MIALEQLEPRHLVAVASFTADLYEDVDGLPGELIDTVSVGNSFFVEIMAREHDPLRAGLAGVSIDFAWDPSVLQVVEPFDPAEIVTTDLPIHQSGTLDNEAGEIIDLSGLSSYIGSGRAIGGWFPEQFALLHFRAEREGETILEMNQGKSRIATMPVSSLSGGSLEFERQAIAVVGDSDLRWCEEIAADDFAACLIATQMGTE